MEEKLYFKPEEYGKKKEKREKSEKKNHKGLKLVIFLIFIVVIIIVVLWLLRGKTTVSGRFPENIKNESLECSATNQVYEKINRIKPASSETKITMIFYGTNELNSINLRHTMHLASNKEAGEAEAIVHVQLAENLASSGLGYEEFDNKFTRIDGDLTLSLYSNSKFKKDTAYEYFLINKTAVPTSLEEFRAIYESQGFICKSSIDK
ncbi:hypothetical protein IJ095_00120 [Candidatus Saccharibacteria bacterium]|nr:hypothetical protein [Candidatus Saccharibacteria bacterium]